MFDITEDPRGFHRLTISGPIDAAGMRDGLEAFLAAVEARESTDFLYTISDFQFPEIKAIAVEFGYLPRLLSSIGRVGRVAVVSDAGWLRRLAEVEGALIPGVTIRSFEASEADAAEAWLTG